MYIIYRDCKVGRYIPIMCVDLFTIHVQLGCGLRLPYSICWMTYVKFNWSKILSTIWKHEYVLCFFRDIIGVFFVFCKPHIIRVIIEKKAIFCKYHDKPILLGSNISAIFFSKSKQPSWLSLKYRIPNTIWVNKKTPNGIFDISRITRWPLGL